MERYNPLKIEQKWQKIWAEQETYKAEENSTKPKKYLAEMFPYPSGAGLHVGHVRNFSIVDALARFYSQNGYNVLRPFGYDTFGLKITQLRPVFLRKKLLVSIPKTSASRLSVSVLPLTGHAKLIPPIPNIIVGPSGVSCNYLKMV